MLFAFTKLSVLARNNFSKTWELWQERNRPIIGKVGFRTAFKKWYYSGNFHS